MGSGHHRLQEAVQQRLWVWGRVWAVTGWYNCKPFKVIAVCARTYVQALKRTMYSGWLTQRTPVDLMMDVFWATKRPFYGWGRPRSAGTEGTMLSQRSCPPVPAQWTIITGMKCSKTNVCFYLTFSVTVTLIELRDTTLWRLKNSNTEIFF